MELTISSTTMIIQPLEKVPGSAVDFGVEIENVSLEDLTGKH